MYRTIGAVNGPGWRPIPNRPLLETSVCLAMDNGDHTTPVAVSHFKTNLLGKKGP